MVICFTWIFCYSKKADKQMILINLKYTNIALKNAISKYNNAF